MGCVMDQAVKETQAQVKIQKKGFLFNPKTNLVKLYKKNLGPMKDVKVKELYSKVTSKQYW